MRVWVCDRCGKQVKNEVNKEGKSQIWLLRPYEQWETGHLCDDCKRAFDLLVNEFFGRTVIAEESK